jgi:cytochrome b involved in lipid metabolism
MQEVATHKSEESCWIVLSSKVYDVTDYLEQHPGGVRKIMEWAGKDATKAFREVNHSIDAINTSEKYYIGNVEKSSSGLIIILVLLAVLGGAFFLWS